MEMVSRTVSRSIVLTKAKTMPKVKIGPKRCYSCKKKDNEVIELDGLNKQASVVAMVDLCDKEKGFMDVPVYKFRMHGHCHAQARPKPAHNHNKFLTQADTKKRNWQLPLQR